MPETLFDRPTNDADLVTYEAEDDDVLKSRQQDQIQGEQYVSPVMTKATYLNRLWIVDLEKPSSRRLRAVDFVIKPLSMLKYPSVAFPALY